MEISNSGEKMKPTTRWMQEKYNELNDWLFGGFLGPCQFEVFTTGKGSQGRTLGHFYMNGRNLKYERYGRKLHITDWDGSKIYINTQNFFTYCKPVIGLNGNYSATEHALLNTLLHEMCHYYVYYKGIYPTQAHGIEFKNIAYRVSNASNGVLNIQRLATAEQMTEHELDSKFVEMKEKRLENKKARITAVFVITKMGIELITTSSDSLINEIIKRSQNSKQCKRVILSNDSELINILFEKGYKKNMRTYRYWEVSHRFTEDSLKQYDISIIECNNTNESKLNKRDEILDYIVENIMEKLLHKNNDINLNHKEEESVDIIPGQILS